MIITNINTKHIPPFQYKTIIITTMAESDRLAALQEFDATKSGVRGLVETGAAAAALPAIFRHPTPRPLRSSAAVSIPTVDLSAPSAAADAAAAARTFGFFQATNHGVPLTLIDRTLANVRAFHELPAAVRSQLYTRDPGGGVNYNSNVDLYTSKAASWRDTIQIRTAPDTPDLGRLPRELREAVAEWDVAAAEMGRKVLGLLSEGLGVEAGRLEGLSCAGARVMACHYHPPCPEPEWTVGTAEHKDPGVVTLLVQNNVSGLQVRWTGGEEGEEVWVDVKPVPGAIVVNVGDFLQILSNDEYKSVQHRALANSHNEPRVSIAVFFNCSKRMETDIYGPLPELVSPEKPARYRNLIVPEFMDAFFSKGLGYSIDKFRL